MDSVVLAIISARVVLPDPGGPYKIKEPVLSAKKATADNYKKLYYDDQHLKGFILIGDVARSGIYTSLIRNSTPLAEIDFDLIKEKPQLMAFSKKTRAEQLGGKK